MKLCIILVTLFTLFCGSFGATIPQWDQFGFKSGEYGEFAEFSQKLVPSFSLSNKLHVTIDHETFCENFRSGEELMFELSLEGEEARKVKVPKDLMSSIQARCLFLKSVAEVKPVSKKIRANIVEKNSGAVIMRNEVRISNGVGALVPLFSTFTLALLFLALFSKSL